MTDSLMFLMVETRPDITFINFITSRFVKNPGYQYTEVVKTILQYLKGLRKCEIIHSNKKKLLIKGYSDSDWAKDKKNRKLTSNFIFILNGGLISWYSKRQSTVTLSSTEAEYIALTLATKKATWLWLLLTEFSFL